MTRAEYTPRRDEAPATTSSWRFQQLSVHRFSAGSGPSRWLSATSGTTASGSWGFSRLDAANLRDRLARKPSDGDLDSSRVGWSPCGHFHEDLLIEVHIHQNAEDIVAVIIWPGTACDCVSPHVNLGAVVKPNTPSRWWAANMFHPPNLLSRAPRSVRRASEVRSRSAIGE